PRRMREEAVRGRRARGGRELPAGPGADPSAGRGDARRRCRVRGVPAGRVPDPRGISRLHLAPGVPVRPRPAATAPAGHGGLRGQGEGPRRELHRLVLRVGGVTREGHGAGVGQAAARRGRVASGLRPPHVGLRVLPPHGVSGLGRPGRRRDYRCAVLGLGALGSAAAYWLARRLGDDVVGLDQFEMGHTKGASEDHSRIIRRSYHTPWYVALTAAAYEAWAEVERRAGEQLVLRTGGLDLWPRDAAIPMRDYVESMRACEVPFEELEGGEVARRWPQWNLSDDVRALYQPDAGLCAASRCNAAHRRLAEEEGAELRDRSAVTAIRHAGGE